MTEGIRVGLDITGDALGLLIGLLPLLVVTALIVLVLRTLPHQLRVHRIRRQERRSGRQLTARERKAARTVQHHLDTTGRS